MSPLPAVTPTRTTTKEDQGETVGPFWRQLPEDKGPHCTACGVSMTAVAFATTKGADAVLCCDGCGRRGVFCECADPWAARA